MHSRRAVWDEFCHSFHSSSSAVTFSIPLLLLIGQSRRLVIRQLLQASSRCSSRRSIKPPYATMPATTTRRHWRASPAFSNSRNTDGSPLIQPFSCTNKPSAATQSTRVYRPPFPPFLLPPPHMPRRDLPPKRIAARVPYCFSVPNLVSERRWTRYGDRQEPRRQERL